MLKEVKILIISLICLVALGGALCALNFLPQFKNEESSISKSAITEKSLEKIIPYSIEELEFVKIKNETSEFTVNLEKQEDNKTTYKIVKNGVGEVSNDLIEQTKVKNLITELLNLTPMQIVEENSKDVRIYGLDSEKTYVTLSFKNSVKTLILGDEAPLSVGYYLKDKDSESKVYLITEPTAESFLNSADSYLIEAKNG